jgi:hypothetical protein
MTEAILSPTVIALGAAVSWVSAAILVYFAFRSRPRVLVLTERAVVAVILSGFLTVYTVVALNTNLDYAFFPFEVARDLLRLGVLLMSAIAPVWVVLWFTGHLSDGNGS